MGLFTRYVQTDPVAVAYQRAADLLHKGTPRHEAVAQLTAEFGGVINKHDIHHIVYCLTTVVTLNKRTIVRPYDDDPYYRRLVAVMEPHEAVWMEAGGDADPRSKLISTLTVCGTKFELTAQANTRGRSVIHGRPYEVTAEPATWEAYL